MPRKNPHPMPVQRETRRRAAKDDHESELSFYRDIDARRESMLTGNNGFRINPAIDEEE